MKNNRQDGFYLDGRYSAKKIEENVDAEIMCVVAEDARESYKEEIIWTLEVPPPPPTPWFQPQTFSAYPHG